MSEPMFSDATELFYDKLPGIYRHEDALNGWTLKCWISGIMDSFQDVDDLIERIKYTPLDDGMEEADLSSDLVDPDTADSAWLPWLAQLVGVQFTYATVDADKRMRIAGAISGTQAGTMASIIQAAQSVLTGTKTVYVYPKSNSVGGVGAGTQWEVLIKTLAAETVSDVLVAINQAGVKPAGIKLYYTALSATWAGVESTYPTWADWDAHTWADIEQV